MALFIALLALVDGWWSCCGAVAIFGVAVLLS